MVIDLPNWVGDQVMALPAIHRLVSGNAGGETTLHSRPPGRRLWEVLFPAAVVVASPTKASPFTTARRLCRDNGRFDLGITLRHAPRAKICLRLTARWSLGSDCDGGRLLLSERYPVDRSRHQVFDADPMLESLGLAGVDPQWRPALPLELVEEGARLLRRSGVAREGALGLAPSCARGEVKRWPAAGYGELARRMRTRGLEVVVVIGPGEESLGREVAAAAGEALPVVGGDSDVAGLAGVLARLALLVCNDSGPMHVAAAVGTPTVALFGPTDPRRTGPLSERRLVLSRGLDCAPCRARCCPVGNALCLRELSVERVERGVLEMLDRG
jgi:ADP-heptose:LPS heptosyltransferase